MGNRRLPTAVTPRNLFPDLWSPGCHKPCPSQESPGLQLLPLLVPTGGFTPATPQSSAAVSLWLGARWNLTALRSLQSRSKYLKRQKWGCTEDGLIKYLQCFFLATSVFSSSSGKHVSYRFTSELYLTGLGGSPYPDGETEGEISGRLPKSF